MKLRYFVEWARRGDPSALKYEPVGVWVQGPGPGLDVVVRYLPGNEDEQQEAEWVLNRLVENDVAELPHDFLEHHAVEMPAYSGIRGLVEETERFPNAEVCADRILEEVVSGSWKGA